LHKWQSESLLRKKQITDGVIASTSRITLASGNSGGLLKNALSNKGFGYPLTGLKTGANDIQEFLINLEDILDKAASAELRRVYCLHLVRNFTGHHFDLSETVTSPKGRTFFDMYEAVLTNILAVVMYFKHINVI